MVESLLRPIVNYGRKSVCDIDPLNNERNCFMFLPSFRFAVVAINQGIPTEGEGSVQLTSSLR